LSILQMSAMVLLLLLLAAVLMEGAGGRPALPPLPVKDGCFVASSEVELFRVEGEAVILSFPMFSRVLQVRRIAPSWAKVTISRSNGSVSAAREDKERVLQSNKQLWFLPAKASDSGEYTCTFRSGQKRDLLCNREHPLRVYERPAADMRKLSFPVTAAVGEKLTIRCPSIRHFNSTHGLIEWYKDSVSTKLQPDTGSSFLNGNLLIPAVEPAHAGVYTCQLSVVINQQQFNVSRAIVLHVEGVCPAVPHTGDPCPLVDKRVQRTSIGLEKKQAPAFQPPVIVSPLNGSVFETPHGSAEEMFCKVLTECQAADSTEVMWLVNSQSVESSYLDGRALQGGRRVTRVSEGCQIERRLIVLAISEKDVGTELKCVTQNQAGRREVVTRLQLEDSTFTWLLVAMVAGSCFLTVVSVFLWVLFKAKRKKNMDYVLARQNSTF
uniref:Ig-like domain-containing protein n=1 Tax=Tetraodon nigroviridis TaxID=99883 RepID=H3DE20_TETNG